MFGPISGAHFNPAVTLVEASQGGLPWHGLPAKATMITHHDLNARPRSTRVLILNERADDRTQLHEFVERGWFAEVHCGTHPDC
jgi:hypothetical protein